MDLHLRGEISRRSFLTCLGAGFIATQTAYANRDSGKEVYLTIDDGPSPNMKKILDELIHYLGQGIVGNFEAIL